MRYHVSWGTYGSWLPGDPRGFRTRGHRQHVEGDYTNPPPPGLYEGLHRDAKARLTRPAIVLPVDLRPVVGQACLEQLVKESAGVHALSVGGEHVHVALICPGDGLKQTIGRAKKVASHRIRDRIPGKVWTLGCHVVAVRQDDHWANVLAYIRKHARNSWVWTP